jgi:hypothetical protein
MVRSKIGNIFILVSFMSFLATGCNQIYKSATPTLIPTIIPTETATATSTPEPSATPIPQEILTSPESASLTETYPSTLSADTVKNITPVEKTDSFDLTSKYVTDLMSSRKATWEKLGLNLMDSSKEDYVVPKFVVQKKDGVVTGWDFLLFDKDGHVASWLQIKDDTAKDGWRWGLTSMWDPKLTPVEGESKMVLPDKITTTIKKVGTDFILGSDNYFEVVFIGKSEILVEFDKEGNPKRWLDTLNNKMEWLEGVEKVGYLIPEGGSISHADAQKITGSNGEVVGFDNSMGGFKQSLTYIVDLDAKAGIIFGGRPGYYTAPPNTVYLKGDVFKGTDGAWKCGNFLKFSDGSGIYIYMDENGEVKVITGVTN